MRLGLLLALGVVNFAHAQAPETIHRRLPAVKTETAPAIDGDLGDEVWKTAPLATGFFDRNKGGPVADQTEARLIYDKSNLYVAIKCLDSNPEAIEARETQEDSRFGGQNSLTEDCCDIRFDAFGTGGQTDVSIFSVNAIGTKSAYLAGGRAKKMEWKGAWDAKVKRTGDGWTAEMRIPWAILNYPIHPSNFLLNFARYQYRTKTHGFWCDVGPNLRNDFAGTWEGVECPAPPRPQLSLLPYVLPGVDNGHLTFRSGIDARYPLTSELTAVATLNPDFGTIEGAVDSIAFTRGERFLPESRPFFLEGSNLFDLNNQWQIGRFFYPRRIDRFDLGTKVYGKATPNDTLGLLHTITFGERSDFVGTWRHKFSNDQSAALMVVNKATRADDNSVVVGQFDDRHGKLNTTFRGATSGGNDRRGHAYVGTLGWEDKHAYTLIQYNRVTDNFRAADGLVDFRGYRGWYAYQNLNDRYKSGLIDFWNVEMEGFWDSRSNGEPFRRGFDIFGLLTTRTDWEFDFYKIHIGYDGVLDNAQGFNLLRGYNNRLFRLGVGADAGVLGGEDYTLWGPRANVRLFRKLDLGYSGSFQNLDGHTKQNILTATYAFSPTRSIGGRMVETNGSTNWYLSYRESGKTGVETFFIIGDPNADKFRSVAQLKVVVPFKI